VSHNPPLRLDRQSSPLRVAVVSDDPIAQAGLEAALRDSQGVELPAPGGDADVVLWDAGSDTDTAHLNAIGDLQVPAVVLIADAGQAEAAIAAGARGVVLRDRVGPSLLAALAAVGQGLTVLDGPLAPRPTRQRQELAEPLTPREREVLELMTAGLSNKQIAAELGISEHTAKFHVNGVLDKCDAETRTEAVVTAVRRGIISL